MLSAEKLISIVAERGLLPPNVIGAMEHHVREMEQCGRHASAKDVAHWLTKQGYLSPDVVEQIFRCAEDRAPDPPNEQQSNHDAQQQIATDASDPVQVAPLGAPQECCGETTEYLSKNNLWCGRLACPGGRDGCTTKTRS